MDTNTLAAIGVILGSVGTILGVIFTFALNAAKQQQAVLQVSIDTLQEDRDYYRSELRKSEMNFNAKVAALEERHNAFRLATEAEREANKRAFQCLNETVDDLREKLVVSNSARVELEAKLTSADQRERELLLRIDQMEEQWAVEREQMQEKQNVERDQLQGQIASLRDNLAKLLQRESLEASNGGKESDADTKSTVEGEVTI